MSDPSLIQAARVIPAREGDIEVTSITAGAASSAIAMPGAGYHKVAVCDGAGVPIDYCYLTAKVGSEPADPNPTATSGTGRTQLYTAAELGALSFARDEQIKVYAVGSGTVYVRVSPSEPA